MRSFISFILLVFASFSTAFAANSASSFGGVGIDGVARADGEIVVRQLVSGGPAQLAGIRIGDVITHVDSKPTKGSDFNEIIERRLRGKAGTKVLIVLHRPGTEKPLRFNLTRKQLVMDKKK